MVSFFEDEKLSQAIQSFIFAEFDYDVVLEGKYILIISIIESLSEYTNPTNKKDSRRLKYKIAPIIKDCWEIFKERIDVPDKSGCSIGNFVEILVNNRNAIAHYDKSEKKYIAEKIETLYSVTESLKWIAYYLLLKRLGISKDICVQRLKYNILKTKLRIKSTDFKNYKTK